DRVLDRAAGPDPAPRPGGADRVVPVPDPRPRREVRRRRRRRVRRRARADCQDPTADAAARTAKRRGRSVRTECTDRLLLHSTRLTSETCSAKIDSMKAERKYEQVRWRAGAHAALGDVSRLAIVDELVLGDR